MRMWYKGRATGQRAAVISYKNAEYKKAERMYNKLRINGYSPMLPVYGNIFIPVIDRTAYDNLHALYLVWKREETQDDD